MIALALLAALAAFALFGIATHDHHRRWRGRHVTRPGQRILRAGAWLLLLVSVAAAVAARGPVFGPVIAFGIVMLAAAIVFLTLNLAPAPRPAPSKGSRP